MTARLVTALRVAALAVALPACGRPFDVETPARLVELRDAGAGYEYRATSATSVVVGIRAIDLDGRGDLGFWEEAITRRLRGARGYSLVDSRPVLARDGTPGRLLRFGHEAGGKPLGYRVALFVTDRRLVVVEAGGPAREVDALAAVLDRQLESLEPG